MKQRLRVWHIPQVPMNPFLVEVDNLVEAKLLLDVFAGYDQFQLDNRVKPDYSNASGVSIFTPDCKTEAPGSEWVDWHPDDTPEFVAACEKLFPDIYSGADNLLDHHLTLEQVRKIVEAMPK